MRIIFKKKDILIANYKFNVYFCAIEKEINIVIIKI